MRNNNGENMNETFTYQYEGIWSIYSEENITEPWIRDDVIPFEVECQYPPKVWDKMEDEHTDEFSEIMSDCYSEVIVDYDPHTERHEGCEDYWRKENE